MLENPFKPITPEEDTDPAQNAKLVEAILGPDAAKKYAELDAGREGKNGDDMSDLTLTDAEKALVKEVKERWDRNRCIEWAESLGKDEKWVDEMFTFHSDGSVECADLDLRYVTELHEFPSTLILILSLDLSRLTSVQDLTLPTEIGCDLILPSLTTAEGLTLPTEIGCDLSLPSLTSAEGLIIPENFHVGCDVYTNRTLLPFFEKLKEEGKVGGDIIVL